MATVKIKWKCHKCEPSFVELTIAERGADEDVISFTHRSASESGKDHQSRNPWCREHQVDLMIPVMQNGIGFSGPELTPEEMERMRKQCNG